MRTVIKFVAMIAIMFTAAVGTAKDPSHSLVTKNDSKSFIFHMNLQLHETTVSLLNMENETLYIEHLKSEYSYDKVFKMDNLEDGSYTLKAENSLKTVTYYLELTDGVVKMVKMDENVKPIFRRKGDIVYLSLLNLSKNDVRVNVLDSQNRVVFDEKFSNTILVEKVFNFEKAFNDSYSVIVKDDFGTYIENIEVE